MNLKAGDICEIVQGPFPLSQWAYADLIGKRTTILGLSKKNPNYYIVDATDLCVHEKALRKIQPPRDDLKTVSWDAIRKECGWSPYGISA